MPSGELHIKILEQYRYHLWYIIDISENGTVEVVNVVMNNMEKYLPSNVADQEEEM